MESDPPARDSRSVTSGAARGKVGEQLAAAHLARSGWTLLGRNFRAGRHEIDLIARRGDIVAFIEVKARSGARFGHPLEAIDPAKRREIVQVAQRWIAVHGDPRDTFRFDAIAITGSGRRLRIEHVEDAWGI